MVSSLEQGDGAACPVKQRTEGFDPVPACWQYTEETLGQIDQAVLVQMLQQRPDRREIAGKITP